MTEQTNEAAGMLRIGRILATTGQVSAAGLALVLGLEFLLPGEMIGLVGSASLGAVLLAGLVLGLTLINMLELVGGRASGVGTYLLVDETVGPLGGFLSGWAVLMAEIVLGVLLVRSAAAHLGTLVDLGSLGEANLALGIILLLAILMLFVRLPRLRLLWSLIVAIFVTGGLMLMTALLLSDFSAMQSPTPDGIGTFMRTAGWSIAVFLGLEVMLSSRRRILDRGRIFPRSLVTILVVGIAVLSSVTLALLGMGASIEPETGLTLAALFSSHSQILAWSSAVLAILVSLLAFASSIAAMDQQLSILAAKGALPSGIRSASAVLRLPWQTILLLAALGTPLTLWMSKAWLLDLLAGLLIFVMVMVNAAAIESRRVEPGRSRPFIVPLFPLIPAVAIALLLGLLFALPISGLLGGALWILIGLLIYFSYSRSHLVEAMEGVSVFGRTQLAARPEGSYRILVPILEGQERKTVLNLATSLARQLNGELIPLNVLPVADPLSIDVVRQAAKKSSTLFQWSTRLAERGGVRSHPITRLARSVTEGILDTAVEDRCDLIMMSWPIDEIARASRIGGVLQSVVRRAPCDVAVATYPRRSQDHEDDSRDVIDEEGETPAEKRADEHPLRQILVPTAGGPHAPLAIRLALLLALESGATTRVVYVADKEASQKLIADGEERIGQTLAKMRELAAELPGQDGKGEVFERLKIESEVVPAESVVDGITSAGGECDLVLIGASEESLIDQVLFGTIPERVALGCPSPVLMVKRFRGLRRFWLQRAWDALYGAFPTLSGEERIAIYKRVRRQARPDVDFFVMIGLSAVIATFGLLQDSAAVIIGAMLVAPLFTPILAFSLAIVQGDLRLLRLALESALKGIALAIGVGIVITVLSPLRSVTPEIAARTQPNLFDLAVALASGAAGAYAISRRDVAPALPGVAIAAALLPPLGVSSIGLALGDLVIAGGGGLLFVTNLIAIALAGAITLLLLGFRPDASAERESRLRLGLAVSLALLVIVSIPLASLFVRSVRESRTEQAITRVLTHELDGYAGLELIDFEFVDRGDLVDVTATVYAREHISSEEVRELNEILGETLGRPVDLHLRSIPIEEIEAPAP